MISRLAGGTIVQSVAGERIRPYSLNSEHTDHSMRIEIHSSPVE